MSAETVSNGKETMLGIAKQAVLIFRPHQTWVGS
jgi:hypothetical protein